MTVQRIGASTDQATSGNDYANGMSMSRFQASASGSLSEIKVKCSGNGYVKVALYADSSGSPGSRLAKQDTSTAVASGWNTITLESPYTISSGTYYWLACAMNSGDALYWVSGGGSQAYKSITYSSYTFPSSESGLSTNSNYTMLQGWGPSAYSATSAVLLGNKVPAAVRTFGSRRIASILLGNKVPAAIGGKTARLFGNDVGAETFGIDTLWHTKFTCSVTGYITHIRIKSNGNANVNVGLYSDSGGEPSARLSVTSAAAVVNGWNLIKINPVACVAGTTYWLTAICDTSDRILGDFDTGTMRYKVSDYSDPLPSPAGSGYTSASYQVDIEAWGVSSATAYIVAAVVYVADKITASRTWGIVRAASVLLGAKVLTAVRTWGIRRAANILVGAKTLTAVRIWGTTKASSVLLGVKSTASRLVGRVRTSTVIVGAKTTANRVVAWARSSSTLIVEKASGTMAWGVYRASAVLVGVVSAASRVVGRSFTVTKRVAASADDCRVYTGSSVAIIEGAVIVGKDGTLSTDAGYRFTGINVPAGATISSAYVTFTCYYNSIGNTCNTDIYGEQGNNVAQYSTTLSEWTGRTKTTAKVDWNSVEAWYTGNQYNTPDIKTIIQELVDDYGELSNAAIAIMLFNDGSSNNAGRNTIHYDYNHDSAALLTINYTLPGDYIRQAIVYIGDKITASRAWGVARAAIILVGDKITATRAWGTSRIASVLLGVISAALYDLTGYIIIHSAVIIGAKATAARTASFTRASAAYIGLSITALRAWGTSISSRVYSAVSVAASRSVGTARQSAVAVGISLTAARTLAALRDAEIYIGSVVTASRAWGTARLASLSAGVASSAASIWGFGRSSAVSIGSVVTASRAWGLARSSVVAVGLALDPSRLLAAARSSAFILGLSLEALRVAGRVANSVVSVVVALSAARLYAASRASAVYIGLYITAAMSTLRIIVSVVIIGINASASRVLGFTRAAAVAVGLIAAGLRTIAETILRIFTGSVYRELTITSVISRELTLASGLSRELTLTSTITRK